MYDAGISDRILEKLIDQDLVKSVDYPNEQNCYDDVQYIIKDVLKDYIIIKGEIVLDGTNYK